MRKATQMEEVVKRMKRRMDEEGTNGCVVERKDKLARTY